MINGRENQEILNDLRASFDKSLVKLNPTTNKWFFPENVIRERFIEVLGNNFYFDVKEPTITKITKLDYVILTLHLYIVDDEGKIIIREVGMSSEKIKLIEDKLHGNGQVPMNLNNSLKIALSGGKKDAMVNVIGDNAKPKTYGFNYSHKKDKKAEEDKKDRIIKKKKIKLTSLFKSINKGYSANAVDMETNKPVEMIIWENASLDKDTVLAYLTKAKIDIPFFIGINEVQHNNRLQYHVAKFYGKEENKC